MYLPHTLWYSLALAIIGRLRWSGQIVARKSKYNTVYNSSHLVFPSLHRPQPYSATNVRYVMGGGGGVLVATFTLRSTTCDAVRHAAVSTNRTAPLPLWQPPSPPPPSFVTPRITAIGAVSRHRRQATQTQLLLPEPTNEGVSSP